MWHDMQYFVVKVASKAALKFLDFNTIALIYNTHLPTCSQLYIYIYMKEYECSVTCLKCFSFLLYLFVVLAWTVLKLSLNLFPFLVTYAAKQQHSLYTYVYDSFCMCVGFVIIFCLSYKFQGGFRLFSSLKLFKLRATVGHIHMYIDMYIYSCSYLHRHFLDKIVKVVPFSYCQSFLSSSCGRISIICTKRNSCNSVERVSL